MLLYTYLLFSCLPFLLQTHVLRVVKLGLSNPTWQIAPPPFARSKQVLIQKMIASSAYWSTTNMSSISRSMAVSMR